MSTPVNVRRFGWIRSRTQAAMMSRSGKLTRCADGASESHEGGARHDQRQARPDRSPWPFTISRARSRGCPSSPASICSSNAAGETLYVGKARVLRDRVRSYLGAAGHEPAHRRAAARRRLGSRSIVTDSVRRGAGAREPPDQAAQSAVQRPAARRQDLSVPAADDDRARRRGCWSRAASSATATSTPGRSCRRRVARRTMSLAHRLFGIRSCNEIIDGKRDRPCLEYDIKRCLAPCVEAICTHRAVRPARSSRRGC